MKASVPVTIYFLLLLLLLLCAPQRLPAAVAQTTGNRDILLVHSHAMADFSQHLLCRSFIHEMNSADYFCTFHQLELHCRNGDMQQAAERRIEQLLPDLSTGKYDAVVAIGTPAYKLFLKHLPAISPKTAVVLLARDDGEVTALPDRPNAMVRRWNLSAVGTAALAQQLFPDRRHIILLSNHAPNNQALHTALQRFAAKEPDLQLHILFAEDMSDADMSEFLRERKDDSLLIYHNWIRSSGRSAQEPFANSTALFFSQIFSRYKIPLFVLQEEFLQYGVIGGNLLPNHLIGASTARSLREILSGAHSIPALQAPPQPRITLDWKMLRLFAVSKDRIPAKALLLNQPDSLWTIHQKNIILGACALFATLTVALLLEYRHLLRHQRESKRKSEQLSLTLHSIGEAVIVTDAEGRITIMNRIAEELSGWPKQDAFKHDINEVLLLSDTPVSDPFNLALHNRQCVHLHRPAVLTSRSGQHFRISLNVSTISHHRTGATLGAVMVFRDVTEEFQHQEKLSTALEVASRAERAKSVFLSTMSHEIRAPLNVVIGCSELLQQPCLPASEHQDYLKAIQFASNTLLMLINNILDLAKLEAGKLKLNTRACDIKQILEEICTIFSLQAKEKKLELTVQKTAEKMPQFILDDTRLRQIILNLVSNALKFTSRGSITVSAAHTITPDTEGLATLEISVADTGAGMSRSFQNKLFQPYQQEMQAGKNSDHTASTGLGLSISFRLAEAMGGTLTASSEEGKGSTFTLTLTGVPCQEYGTVETGRRTEQRNLADIDPALQVLIVDDQHLNVLVLDRILRKFHLQPLSAPSGKEALEILQQKKVDLLLTDLKMPEMDGCELAAAIRLQPRLNDLQIAVVTADSFPTEDYDLSLFDGILVKPITGEKIAGLLAAASQGRGRHGHLPNEMPPAGPDLVFSQPQQS